MPTRDGPTEWAEDVVASWVRASCNAQGVPEHISDLAVLKDVCTLLGKAGPTMGGGGETRTASEARTRPAVPPTTDRVA